jgi:Glycosyl hydrolase family 26.
MMSVQEFGKEVLEELENNILPFWVNKMVDHQHENTGSWFWWGEKLCTVSEYRAL